MTLLQLSHQITDNHRLLLPPEHKLNTRLVCPEYSKSAQEVKTYPLMQEERVFALCWNIQSSNELYATMCPSPQPFCCCHHFADGEKTQLHTHDYIELAYIMDGRFSQRILGNDISFSRGDLCLIDKNCIHQDYLLSQPASILFLGISNDMFSEIMEENVTAQKIMSFLQ